MGSAKSEETFESSSIVWKNDQDSERLPSRRKWSKEEKDLFLRGLVSDINKSFNDLTADISVFSVSIF